MYPAIPLPIKVNIEIKILDFTVTKNARKQASGLAMFVKDKKLAFNSHTIEISHIQFEDILPTGKFIYFLVITPLHV
jgi:hypothetical protein